MRKKLKNDVRVHVVDDLGTYGSFTQQDKQTSPKGLGPHQTIRLFNCSREVIIETMQYFKEHLKKLNVQEYESIDIHV